MYACAKVTCINHTRGLVFRSDVCAEGSREQAACVLQPGGSMRRQQRRRRHHKESLRCAQCGQLLVRGDMRTMQHQTGAVGGAECLRARDVHSRAAGVSAHKRKRRQNVRNTGDGAKGTSGACVALKAHIAQQQLANAIGKLGALCLVCGRVRMRCRDNNN